MDKVVMVYLKDTKLFLGIKVKQNNDKSTLDQCPYLRTVLNKFRPMIRNPTNTPMKRVNLIMNR